MSECYAPDPIDAGTPELPEATDGLTRTADLDGDGYEETVLDDSDGDGVLDSVFVDVDGDFSDDIAAFDNTPGDERFVADVLALAFDGDGLADVVLDDTDLDGVFETVTPGGDEPLVTANPYGIFADAVPLDGVVAQQS